MSIYTTNNLARNRDRGIIAADFVNRIFGALSDRHRLGFQHTENTIREVDKNFVLGRFETTGTLVPCFRFGILTRKSDIPVKPKRTFSGFLLETFVHSAPPTPEPFGFYIAKFSVSFNNEDKISNIVIDVYGEQNFGLFKIIAKGLDQAYKNVTINLNLESKHPYEEEHC